MGFPRGGVDWGASSAPAVLVLAAEAVDEAAIAFRRALGRGKIDRAEQAALFGGLAARLGAGFGFAIERLGNRSGAALLA